MWEGVDKRRFPRVRYLCEIIVIKKGQKEKFSTNTENIGVGGVCVILKKDLRKFCPVELILYLKNGDLPLECDGRVVWVVRSKEEFDTGIEFIDIKERDRLRIDKIVQSCLKERSIEE